MENFAFRISYTVNEDINANPLTLRATPRRRKALARESSYKNATGTAPLGQFDLTTAARANARNPP